MYDIFCNLTHPSSPITAPLSPALDCRSLSLSFYIPMPSSSTRLLLAQPLPSVTILVPAWPRSLPKPSAQTRPLHFAKDLLWLTQCHHMLTSTSIDL